MKTVNVGFGSSWRILDSVRGPNRLFTSSVAGYAFNEVPANEADYYFFTVYDARHHAEARPDAIKIFFSGENYCPDFNACDYAMGSDHLAFGDRYLRVPLYLAYPDVDRLTAPKPVSRADLRTRTRFCNFIYSNNRYADPERDAFFRALDARRKVHSAGRHLRNTATADSASDDPDANARKRAYMRGFRFSLAFENSSHPGYVTEKILDAYIARTIPIYWGDPLIGEEFNPDSFVDVRAFASRDEAIDRILALDSDEDAMLAMLNASPLRKGGQIAACRESLRAFMDNIFAQDLAAARRRPRAGFVGFLEEKRRRDATGLRRYMKRNRV